MRPIGAKAIIDMRANGFRPVVPVLVSLIGRLPPIDGPMVIPDPELAYDWSFLAGLETHVWLREGIPARKTLLALAAAGADILQVWDVDLKKGAWVVVDNPTVHEKIAATLESKAERRARGMWEKRFEGPGVELWLSPWGPIMNEEYARDAAHVEVPCKS